MQEKEVYYGAYIDEEAGMGIVEEVYVEAAERETKLLQAHSTEQEEKLSKAKVLIRRLINACCSYGATGKTTAEAEQFLKEE